MLFEGNPLAYAAGVRGAEMLIVDSIMIEALPQDWVEIARREMVGRRRVVVFRRDGGLEALELPPPDEMPPAPAAATARVSSEESDTLMRQGLALAKAGNYAGAIKRFEQALEADPDNAQVLKFRAAAYLRTKQYREALADYEAYMESDAWAQDEEQATIRERIGKLRGMS
jgi:tetratricopeptide (TPR) repeat protein